MAQGRPVGTMFVELSLDATKYTKAQKEILAGAEQNSANIEKAFKTVGITSDKMYDAMRKNITNHLESIKRSHLTTAEEKVRAEQSAHDKIQKINEQQFGKQKSMLDSMKEHWVATTVAAAAMWTAVNKAKEWAELGAKAEQAALSFRMVAETAGESADELIAALERASAGTIDRSAIMQKAVKGMVLDLKGSQLIEIMEAARVAARMSGVDVQTAYEGITNAIAVKLPKSLRQYGLVSMDEAALVKKAMKEGVEDINLYTIAMINAQIHAAKFGSDLSTTTSENIQKFHARITELKETMGEFVILVGQKLLAGMTGLAGVFTVLAAPLALATGGVDAMKAALASADDLFKKSAEMLGSIPKEQEAVAEGSKKTAEQLKEEKKAWMENVKAQIEGKKIAEDRAKETENATKQIIQAQKKAEAEIAGIGKTEYQKKVALLDAEVEKYKQAGVKKELIAQYVATQTEKFAKETAEAWKEVSEGLDAKMAGQGLSPLEKQIISIKKEAADLAEKFGEVPGALEKITAWSEGAQGEAIGKAMADALKFVREEEARLGEEREKAQEEYRKIVDESNAWSVSSHQKAINEIVLSEGALTAKLYELWDAYKIDFTELQKGLAAVRGAKDAAIEAQEKKKLESELSFYQQVLGFEDEFYAKKLEWIDKEAAAKKQAGLDSLAVDQWAKQEEMKAWAEHQAQKVEVAEIAFSTLKDLSGALYELGGEKRGVAFEAYKATAAAEAVIDTYKGATAAYAAMAPIPIVGPALGVAAAAAAIAAGAARVQKILSQKPGSVSVSDSGGGAIAGPSGASTVLGGAPGEASESVAHITKLLEDTYSLEYRELTGIHKAIISMNQNIEGMVEKVFRGGGFTAGSAGITQGISGGSRVFGGAQGQTVLTMGLRVQAQKIADLIIEEWNSSIGFALIEKTKSGGWFHSKKTWQELITFALNEDQKAFDEEFGRIMIDLGKTIVEATRLLGGDVQKAMAYVFPAFDLNLYGLSAENMQKKIEEYISGLGDIATEAILGDLIGEYQKIGEGLLETAIRIVTDIAVVGEMLDQVGQSFGENLRPEQVIEYTEALIDFAEQMGLSLDELKDATDSYYQNFFSEAEQIRRQATFVAESLADIGIAMPETRDAYRDLVESLDLTTAAGREAYVMLMMLAESASDVYDAQERLVAQWGDLQDRLLELQGDDAAILARQREREMAATDEQLHVLLEAIYAQEDYNAAAEELAEANRELEAATENVTKAMADVDRAAENLANAQDAVREASERVIDAQQRYDEAVVDAADSLADANARYEEAVRDGAKRIADAHANYAEAVKDAAERVADAQERYADAVERGAEQVAKAQQAYQDALARITDAEEAYADAQRAYADEVAKQDLDRRRAELETRLDLEARARQAEMDRLQAEKEHWDEQAKLYDEQVNAQEDYVNRLKSVSESVKGFLSEMTTGSLAPVQSRTAMEQEYQRLKALATEPGAEPQAVSDFLSYAKQYLEFQRSYGGDYLSTFNRVMEDVKGIGEQADAQLVVAEQQLETAKAAAEDAKANAERIASLLEQAKVADEAANEEGQRLLEELNQTADDSAQRLADLQEAIDEAAQGVAEAQAEAQEAYEAIAEAQAEAAENTADALQAIADAQAEGTQRVQDALEAIAEAEADYAERVDDAAQAIVDAQEQGDEAIQNALDAIADAQEGYAESQRNVEEAARELVEAQERLAEAEREQLEAQKRVALAAEREYEMSVRLAAAMERLANAPPPTVIVNVPLPPPPTGGPPPPIYNPPEYETGPPPPPPPPQAQTFIPNPFDETQTQYWGALGYFWNPTAGRWLPWQEGYWSGATGGLMTSPTIGGEAGGEWFVPTYEPQRSQFLRNAPAEFWANLTNRNAPPEQQGGEITITVPVTIDGKVLAEVVAKHVPRSSELATAIRRVR